MTALELVLGHPWASLIVFLGAGAGVANVVRAVVEPLAPCRRGDCPRCNGTGREERINRAPSA